MAISWRSVASQAGEEPQKRHSPSPGGAMAERTHPQSLGRRYLETRRTWLAGADHERSTTHQSATGTVQQQRPAPLVAGRALRQDGPHGPSDGRHAGWCPYRHRAQRQAVANTVVLTGRVRHVPEAAVKTPPDSMKNGRADPAVSPLRIVLSSGCSPKQGADQAAPRPVGAKATRPGAVLRAASPRDTPIPRGRWGPGLCSGDGRDRLAARRRPSHPLAGAARPHRCLARRGRGRAGAGGARGLGARLLALEGADGLWAGGACFPAGYTGGDPGQPWTATMHTLQTLELCGLAPASASARRAMGARRAALLRR